MGSIAHRMQDRTGADNSPVDGAALAILKLIARDDKTAQNAALPVATMLANPQNEWARFTVRGLGSALRRSNATINRALLLLGRRGYLEERIVHRQPGQREARLTFPHETPGATR